MKYCTNCGHALKDEAQFCPECGTTAQKPVWKKQQAERANPEQLSDAMEPGEPGEDNPDPEQEEPDQWAESDNPEQLSEETESGQSEGSDNPEPFTEEIHSEPEKHTPEQQPQQTATPNARQNKGKKPFFKSRKSKMLTMIVVVLGIVLFGSYYTINKMLMSPEAVADRFMDAVKEKDTAGLRSFINEGQLEMDATKADVEAFLDFLNERPQMITAMSGELEKDVKQNKSHSDYADAVSDREDKPLATLKKDGKKWFLFDRYIVNVMPVYMEVSSTEDETTIFVGDNEAGTVASEKAKKLGPFLPGIYEVKAVVEGDYGKVEDVQEADFSEIDEGDVNPDFDFTDHYVELYSDNSDAILYVNGENTKEKVRDIGALGPVPKDGSVELFAQKKFSTGVKKSDKVKIDKDTYDAGLYLDYDDYDEEYDIAQGNAEDQKEKDEAIDVIYDHYEDISNEDFESAYNLFSSNMQNKFSVEGWADGLTDTIKDDVTLAEVDSIDDDTAKVYMEMTSYDEDDDSVLVKEWEGYWTLVKEGGEWKMDETELDEVDSWTE